MAKFWNNKIKKIKRKDMDWGQAKARYPKLSPFGDVDRDGVKNWLDCKPFDRRRHKKYIKTEEEWKEDRREVKELTNALIAENRNIKFEEELRRLEG